MLCKWAGSIVVLLAATVSASAASPSFDCRKATKFDEKAICANDQLATNDIETTSLFNTLRSVNRVAALSIARDFLADRAKCRTDECIAHLQSGAIMRFKHALSSGWQTTGRASAVREESAPVDRVMETPQQVERSQPARVEDGRLRDAEACAALEDSLQRLTCFDRVFPKSRSAARTIDTTTPGLTSPWNIKREKSAIDDTAEFYAHLRPVEQSGSALGRDKMSLLLRCTESTTAVLITTDMFMTDDPLVTIRIGSAPAQSSTWSRSTTYQTVGLWSGDSAIPFLRSLRNDDRLVVRIEASRRQEATFNLGNVEDVVAEVAATCGWRP